MVTIEKISDNKLLVNGREIVIEDNKTLDSTLSPQELSAVEEFLNKPNNIKISSSIISKDASTT